jgi:Ca2+-binding EF-hand superfamily protein
MNGKARALRAATPGDARLKEMREIFAMFDEDGSGSIDASELGRVLDAMGVRVGKAKLAEMIREVDTPGGESSGWEGGHA